MYRKAVSWFLWHGEDLGARIISKFFWPPSAAACIVIDDGKVLAVDAGEYLMLPGGIVESGEMPEEAAFREVKEETGLEVNIIGKVEEKLRGVSRETIFYAEIMGGELKPSWEGKPKWIPLEKVGKKAWRYGRDVESLIEKAEGEQS